MDPNPELHTGCSPPTPPLLNSHPTCYQLQDCNEQRRAETEEESNGNKKFSKDSISEGMKLWRGPTRLYKPAAFCFPPSIFSGISSLLSFLFQNSSTGQKVEMYKYSTAVRWDSFNVGPASFWVANFGKIVPVVSHWQGFFSKYSHSYRSSHRSHWIEMKVLLKSVWMCVCMSVVVCFFFLPVKNTTNQQYRNTQTFWVARQGSKTV